MKIEILTLFPEMFDGVIRTSILGKAGEKGVLNIRTIDIRKYSKDKHNKADDYPFGGGVGMVMLPQPIFDTLDAIDAKGKKIIYMSPRGEILNQEKVQSLAKLDEMVILCGHYEGIDQRVIDNWQMEEISIGDFITTGGELPAMVLIDSVARFIPDVLGTEESAADESIYSGLLEYDQYTKPREYRGLQVPEVLYSGNHKAIALWKFENSVEKTAKRRPDLLDLYIRENWDNLSKEQKTIIKKHIEKNR